MGMRKVYNERPLTQVTPAGFHDETSIVYSSSEAEASSSFLLDDFPFFSYADASLAARTLSFSARST